MAEPYAPLLPWKVLGGLLLLLATWGSLTGAWDPFAGRERPGTRLRVRALPARVGDGEAVLFIGNSRLAFPLRAPGALTRLLAGAGLSDAEAALEWEPALRFSELFGVTSRLAAFHPTIVVTQVDLFFPPGERRAHEGSIPRLLGFERSGPSLTTGLEIVDLLRARRRIAVELPLAARVAASMDAAWASDRARARALLRARGYELLADPAPWPDALFTDGVHLDPTGAARLLPWLARGLRAR